MIARGGTVELFYNLAPGCVVVVVVWFCKYTTSVIKLCILLRNYATDSIRFEIGLKFSRLGIVF